MLKRWQYEAVERIAKANEIYLLEAKGERPASRKPVLHGAYYLLNLAAIRGPLAAARPFPDDAIGIRDRISFEVAYEKSWAVLPDEAIAFARKQRLDAIVKFSLNLLRIPSPEVLTVPILSYHHGDPRSFRGRPAGYYEIESGSDHLGQIVQILSNRLDAGEVLAATQTPVFPHSYRRTLREAYAMSPHLLPRALDALRSGTRIDWAPTRTNYRLPTNRSVLRFAGARLTHTGKRLLYGAFGEKRWAVSTVRLRPGEDAFDALASDADDRWSTPAIPRGYSFLAEPFILKDGALVVEALERRSGTGALSRLHAGAAVQLVHASAGHLSYPAVIEQGGEDGCCPKPPAGLLPPSSRSRAIVWPSGGGWISTLPACWTRRHSSMTVAFTCSPTEPKKAPPSCASGMRLRSMHGSRSILRARFAYRFGEAGWRAELLHTKVGFGASARTGARPMATG